MAEPGISDDFEADPCDALSPGGWHCCLPKGHDHNHIGTTQGWGKLYQWPQVSPEATS